VKTNRQLPQVSESELREMSLQICADADQGIQTAIMSNDGKTVLSIVGLNGCRYLPDPDPDPLDEMVNMILDEAREGRK